MDLEQLSRLQQELQSHPCLWCQTTQYNLENGIHFIFGPPQPNGQGQALPFVIVTCLNCGFEYFFNAIVRRLVPVGAQMQVEGLQQPVLQEPMRQVQELTAPIKTELDELYALENRAGVLMAVCATVIALVFAAPNIPQQIGFINITILAPLLGLVPAFFFYLFTFLPSLRIKIVANGPATPAPTSTVVLNGFEEVKSKLEKASSIKPARIRLGHSTFAAGIVGLVVAQLFTRYAGSFAVKQTWFEYLLEFLLIVALEGIVVVLVKMRFKSLTP